MKTAIICAQGIEECEGLLTYDLLKRAGVDVELIGLDKNIKSSHNVNFETDHELKDIDIKEYDCLVLPGGIPGTNNLEASPLVQDAIDYFMSSNKLIAAVCAAPSILLNKGLLNSNEFTCYPGFEGNKERLNVKAHKHNNIITGVGLGGTIEFAALIISTLLGEDKAKEVLKKIQY